MVFKQVKQILQISEMLIENFLRSNSYKTDQENIYIWENGFIKDKFIFEYLVQNNKIAITYTFYRKFKLIEEYWEDLKSKNSTEEFTFYATQNQFKSMKEDVSQVYFYINLKSNAPVMKKAEKFRNEFVDEYYQHIIPYLNQLDLQKMDSILNENPILLINKSQLPSSEGLAFKKIIVAKLVGNQNYEFIYNTIKFVFEKHVDHKEFKCKKDLIKLEIIRKRLDKLNS